MGLLDAYSVIGDIFGSAGGGQNPSWYSAYQGTFPGSFSVTLGSSVSSFILSGRQTHIFGDEIKFVFDYETLASQFLGEFCHTFGNLTGGWAGGLLAGASGNITMGIGTNASCAYFGPKYGIDRLSGPICAVKSEKGVFGTDWRTLGAGSFGSITGITGKAATPDLQNKIMATTGVIVLILLVIMAAVSLAFELLAVLKYPKLLASTSAGDKANSYLFRDLDTALTSRLMAAIFQVEKIAAVGVSGVHFTSNAERNVKSLGQVLKNWVWADEANNSGWLRYLLYLGETNVLDALKKWGWVLLNILILGVIAVMIAAAAGAFSKKK